MRIEHLEVIPVSIPFTHPVTISGGTVTTQESVVVRISGDDGAMGLGETQPISVFAGCTETWQTVVAVVQQLFAPCLIGRDPLEVAKIDQNLQSLAPGAYYARAAVIDAVYDLLARAAGVPLCKYLGGCYREEIQAVWSVGMKSEQEMAKEARRAVDRGYRMIKCKIGGEDAKTDVASVAAIREAVGSSISLRVDANAGLSYRDALLRLKPMVEDYQVELVEQPLATWDLDGMRHLSDVLAVPVMADESAVSPQSVMELVCKRAVSIIDIKLAKMGGTCAAQRSAVLAEEAGVPLYAGGQVATSVGAATAAHFFAATQHAVEGDFQLGPDGWLAVDIVKTPLEVKDGCTVVPMDSPGIGVTLEEPKLEALTLDS